MLRAMAKVKIRAYEPQEPPSPSAEGCTTYGAGSVAGSDRARSVASEAGDSGNRLWDERSDREGSKQRGRSAGNRGAAAGDMDQCRGAGRCTDDRAVWRAVWSAPPGSGRHGQRPSAGKGRDVWRGVVRRTADGALR